MWRCEASRSGSTAHALPHELKLQWKRTLLPPDPAFDYHFRLCADQSYEPVAAGGLLFVPSNVSDSVAAYDLGTGQERWRFVTEGPVRFAPVAAGGRVWFASDDGHLYCVDAATGALRWKVRGAPDDRADYRMLVNGRMSSRWPARGGPVLAGETIYFGCGVWPSEGVFLLAVDANTGAVRWRNSAISQIDDGLEEHGLMADLGLPPHGYLALIAGKLAMPSGRALAAFCDPRTGKLDPYNSFYAKVYPVPRGAWAVCGNRDYWFQGGTLFATGSAILEKLPAGPMTVETFAKLCGKPVAWAEKLIQDKAVAVKAEGGQRLVLFDARSQKLAMNLWGHEPKPVQRRILEARPPVQMDIFGTRHEVGVWSLPVFTETTMFRSELKDVKNVEVQRGMTRVRPPKYDSICAYDLRDATWELSAMRTWTAGTGFQRYLRFKKLWELETPLAVRIHAGDRLYAACENQIAAIAPPAAGGRPTVVWRAEVDGFPVGVIAASGHLIVTTDTGKLYAFGAANDAQPKIIAAEKPVTWERQPEWRSQITKLKGGLSGGNALVLGWNSGELAKELALQTQMRVIVAEPDATIAAKARAELAKAGAWATRIHILTGTSDALKLPPYFAEVVLSEAFTGLDQGARIWTRVALDALRPYTGLAVLPLRPQLVEQAKAHAGKSGGYEFTTEKRWTTIRRVAAPKGADDWTHEAANAGNTFASRDTLAVPPFGLLWYSGSIDREFSPAFEFQHNRNPYPTIAAGRMFMLAASELHAVDAYTGRHLWKATVAESAKAGRRLADHRTFSRPTDQNLIATADRVYVFREADAQVFDPATGKHLGTLEVPAALRGDKADAPWDEVRIAGDTMFVTTSKTLVAMDRRTGSVRWSRAGEQEHVAFGLSEDRVFTVDYTTARGQNPAKVGPFETKIIVLDAKNGDVHWTAPLKAPSRPDQSERSAGKPKWSGICQDNPLKPTLHYSAAQGVVLAIVDRHQFYAFYAQSGSPLWQYHYGARLADLVTFEPPTVTSNFVICGDGTVLDVRTGKPAGPEKVGGRGTGCNRFVGSDALITFRSALACYLNLETKERTYFSSTRPGCSNSMIPAAGLLNAPNYAHGCVCNYPFLTSYSLFHLPEAARWAPKTKPDVQTQRNPNAN